MATTLQISRTLQEKGFDKEQAETLAEVIRGETGDRLATKDDIAEIKAEIAELRKEIRWIIGLGAIWLPAVLAIFKYLP